MAEGKSSFVYVIYISTTPDQLWKALTSSAFMKKYWFNMDFVSDWQPGAAWRLSNEDGRITDSGTIEALEPPRRMVLRWQHQNRPELAEEGVARCTMELEPQDGAVRLTISHEIERADSKLIQAVSCGWPKILSNLKSLLETGEIVLR